MLKHVFHYVLWILFDFWIKLNVPSQPLPAICLGTQFYLLLRLHVQTADALVSPKCQSLLQCGQTKMHCMLFVMNLTNLSMALPPPKPGTMDSITGLGMLDRKVENIYVGSNLNSQQHTWNCYLPYTNSH